MPAQKSAATENVEVTRLASAMSSDDRDLALRSKRLLWWAVRYAGRPGGETERSAIVAELVAALATNASEMARREILWMLSEIGGDESVDPIAAMLSDERVRDDARMALERIPGNRSLAALETGLAHAPEDFRTNMAQSLRKRGVSVPGYPCQKLIPCKPTRVRTIS